MIRLEMEDEGDEYAQAIADIEYRKPSQCKVERWDDEYIWFRDFRGEEFAVLRDSFGTLKSLKSDSVVFSAFAKFRGQWCTVGVSAWCPYNEKKWPQMCEEERRMYDLMHAYDQFEELLKMHNGQRLFFFRDSDDYYDWLVSEQGLKMKEGQRLPRMPEHLFAFLEPNGQMTVSRFASLVNAPDNKYYDSALARDNSLAFVISREPCSPDCLRYLIDNNYLRDAHLKSTEGEEHGLMLAQENLQFLACCMRRDLDWVR